MRFYFSIVAQSGEAISDPDGLELPDLESAWEEATKTAGQILRDLSSSFELGPQWSIEIRDHAMKPVRSLYITARSHD